jgi:hypothetical protein
MEHTPPPVEDRITYHEAADLAGLTYRRIGLAVERGELTGFRFGKGRPFLDKRAVIAWMLTAGANTRPWFARGIWLTGRSSACPW